MSKDIKRVIAVIVCLVIFWLTVFGLVLQGGCYYTPWERYKHPDFVTSYTEAEHIERIKERTEARFSKEIESGEIANYTVEIVYAFYDNDPEYFLVNLEYKNDFPVKHKTEGTRTKYKHFLGYIENDEYYTGINGYAGEKGDSMFTEGRNAYEVAGYGEAKKYYGNDVFAVEKEGALLKIFKMNSTGQVEFEEGYEGEWEQYIIPETEYEDLMKNNYKFSSHIY